MKLVGTCATLATLLLCGCSKPSDDVRKQLEILQRVGSPRDVCTGSKKLAAALLAEHNERDYYVAKVSADISCMHADQLERL
jgi:hypothetical protein